MRATSSAIESAGPSLDVVVREINAGRTEQLEDLLPDLVELTLAPYLGGEEASRLARQS